MFYLVITGIVNKKRNMYEVFPTSDFEAFYPRAYLVILPNDRNLDGVVVVSCGEVDR